MEESTPDLTSWNVPEAADLLRQQGAVRLRGVVPPWLIASLRDIADGLYASLTTEEIPTAGVRFVSSVSSFAIGEWPANATLHWQRLEDWIRQSGLAEWLHRGFEAEKGTTAPLLLNRDQCWFRRQYAPAQKPAGHHPHFWHQDGALHFQRRRDQSLLAMRTVWCPLQTCGDEAPGLEIVLGRNDRRFEISELVSDAVDQRLARLQHEARGTIAPTDGVETRWIPTLDAGDALVLTGDALHRTSVRPEMTQTRTSFEMRFFWGGDDLASLEDERLSTLLEAS